MLALAEIDLGALTPAQREAAVEAIAALERLRTENEALAEEKVCLAAENQTLAEEKTCLAGETEAQAERIRRLEHLNLELLRLLSGKRSEKLTPDDRPWSGPDPPGVIYFYAPGRGGEHAEKFLDGFDGILQVDGYAGYNRLTGWGRKGGAPLQLGYCWAHSRRKLREIYVSSGSEIAAEGLRRIAELYAIEAGKGGIEWEDSRTRGSIDIAVRAARFPRSVGSNTERAIAGSAAAGHRWYRAGTCGRGSRKTGDSANREGS